MDAPFSSLEDSVLDSGLLSIEQPFVARWQRLVSTTNWEKGRIIDEWRAALMAAGSNPADYADEKWGERVGGVTPQHVGRLRRVYHRFGSDHERYAGLFWSHFQAAVDWNDAEMWLEGAVQNGWSISQMRRTRSEAIGAVAGTITPDDALEDSLDSDEDFVPSPVDEIDSSPSGRGEFADVSDESLSSDIDESSDDDDEQESDRGAMIYAEDDGQSAIEFVQPFESLAELPPDYAEAFDALKLAILRHKADSWAQISLDDVVASLDALKQLARSPSSDA
jgi:hypothetical protein